MKTISKQMLIQRGYDEWTPNKLQKCFKDENGSKKYFIDFEIIPKNDALPFNIWVCTCQMDIEGLGAVCFELVQWFNDDQGRTIQDAEDYIEKLFIMNDKPYHEL